MVSVAKRCRTASPVLPMACGAQQPSASQGVTEQGWWHGGGVWGNPSLGCVWGTCPQCCLSGCWQQQGFWHSWSMDTSPWGSAACAAQQTLIYSSLMTGYLCMISKSTNCSHPNLFVGGRLSTSHAVVPYIWLYIIVSCSEINAPHSIAHMVCSQR